MQHIIWAHNDLPCVEQVDHLGDPSINQILAGFELAITQVLRQLLNELDAVETFAHLYHLFDFAGHLH